MNRSAALDALDHVERTLNGWASLIGELRVAMLTNNGSVYLIQGRGEFCYLRQLEGASLQREFGVIAGAFPAILRAFSDVATHEMYFILKPNGHDRVGFHTSPVVGVRDCSIPLPMMQRPKAKSIVLVK